MKRALMLENRELLDFEVDVATGDVCILDAPAEGDGELASLGLGGPDRDAFIAKIINRRRMSHFRSDIAPILDGFDVRSRIELVFRGHGLSLTDKLWYRAPDSTERWEDVNFYDNAWDDTFCEAVLTRDYKRLASCSPDVPDITTGGHLKKTWEQDEDGVHLLKESLFENGVDLEGALLASELRDPIFGRDEDQRLRIVERFGKHYSANPLMVARDEELVQAYAPIRDLPSNFGELIARLFTVQRAYVNEIACG